MADKIANELKSEMEDIQKMGWDFLFHTIPKSKARCAVAEANRQMNRYSDILAFDHSRVKLTKVFPDYINANVVEVSRAGRKYILTQGPLSHTSGHFWLMVWEQESKAIFMLNKVIEKFQEKCHQYWPLGESHGGADVMKFDDVGLHVHYVSEEQSTDYVIKRLRLEDKRTSKSREVLHLHYTAWPDFGVPSTPQSFVQYLQDGTYRGAFSASVGPPVVHCSAGVGRSGTFCLVDSCLLMMTQGVKTNIKDVLLEIRKYRMELVQTSEQLKFAYLAILQGLQQKPEVNEGSMKDGGTGHVVQTVPPTLQLLSWIVPQTIEGVEEAKEAKEALGEASGSG